MKSNTNHEKHSLSVSIPFRGKASHAAAAPDLGRSAFDGLQMAIFGIELLRKHFPEGVDITYSITSSGNLPCNIVSDNAEGVITLYADGEKELAWLMQRVKDITFGAATVTGTTAEIKTS